MDEWVWSNGGMILTGENWSTGRETLYSVGGRWMNEYVAMVEWYWQGKTEVLFEKHVPLALRPPQISHGLTGFSNLRLCTRLTACEWHGYFRILYQLTRFFEAMCSVMTVR